MTEPDEQSPLVLHRDHGRVAASDAPLRDASARPVRDLVTLGFLYADPASGAIAWAEESDRRLLRLLDLFGLTLQLLPACGIRIALTSCWVPVGEGEEEASFVGKGFDGADAVRRCLGELAEFRSWIYHPQEDRGRIDLDPAGPRLAALERLLDCRGGLSAGDAAAIRAPGWCRVEPLGGDARPLWCPAPLCFGRYASPDRAAPDAGLDNSGTAAGRSRDEALGRALLELVERDATGLWWQRGIARPGIDPRRAGPRRLPHALARHGEESGRHCWFLDLTTDIGIPVVAAISAEEDGTLPALGVACRPLLSDAMEGGFLEMVQSELALASLLQRLDEGRPSVADAELSDWYELADTSRMPWLAPHGAPDHRPPEAAPAAVGDRLAACGLAAHAIELTREALGIPVVKAICPGLAHFRRPQGGARLMRLPEQLGWRSLLEGPYINPTLLPI